MVGHRVVLLSDGENVQGEPAAQYNLELVHVAEPGGQHRRDEGVRAQEQESVAGVVLVVVGRAVITAGPHSKGDEILKLNLPPLGALRVLRCAAASHVASAPPSVVSGVTGLVVERMGARAAQAALAGPPGTPADAREPDRRWEEPQRSGWAGGQLLTAKLGEPRWPSRIEPRSSLGSVRSRAAARPRE